VWTNEASEGRAEPAYRYLTRLNRGYSRLNPAAKRLLLDRFRRGDAGAGLRNAPLRAGSFDLVRLPARWGFGERITKRQVGNLTTRQLTQVKLVELKSTRRRLNRDLKGHFFSLQYPEQLAAQALGDRYEIVFVVMAPGRRAFHVIRGWNLIWAKARKSFISFSIQF
jgi:hypothetical protein